MKKKLLNRTSLDINSLFLLKRLFYYIIPLLVSWGLSALDPLLKNTIKCVPEFENNSKNRKRLYQCF